LVQSTAIITNSTQPAAPASNNNLKWVPDGWTDRRPSRLRRDYSSRAAPALRYPAVAVL